MKKGLKQEGYIYTGRKHQDRIKVETGNQEKGDFTKYTTLKIKDTSITKPCKPVTNRVMQLSDVIELKQLKMFSNK